MASSSTTAHAASSAVGDKKDTPQERLAAMLEDPRYKQGVALCKRGQFDEALEFLGSCVALAASEDDVSLAAAPVYFAYGDALLSKAEESVDLFGAAMTAAKEKVGEEEEGEEEAEEECEGHGSTSDAAAASSSNEANSSNNGVAMAGGESCTKAPATASSKAIGETAYEEGDTGGEITKVGIPEDVQDDLEVAWENLEASRVIYHKHEDMVDPMKLGEVYLRLGDLQKANGNFTQAVDDYLRSLEIYAKVCDEDSRVIADLHYQLAMMYIYASVEEEHAVTFKSKALEHYIQCARVFEILVEKARKAAATAGKVGDGEEDGSSFPKEGRKEGEDAVKSPPPPPKSTPAEDLKEFEEILAELRETIEATRQELSAAGSVAKAPGPVTTIGFGQPLASSLGPPAAHGEAEGISRNGSGGGAAHLKGQSEKMGPRTLDGGQASVATTAAVNVMAVKKKTKSLIPTASSSPREPSAGLSAAAAGKMEAKKDDLEPQSEEKMSPKKRLVTEQTEGPAELPISKEARFE
ncbi:nuclear autoantigenic sperm protein [Nannochloropsis gaditana]|uniref:Nuclear autoantigenic sperm protein n=1 Tax=Nannochloropsis gaditana TaxID=72520 RepID=W7U732_9STRA|nr:nuclear autoantigenic sperm protein [Nannochloropsis gaditana]